MSYHIKYLENFKVQINHIMSVFNMPTGMSIIVYSRTTFGKLNWWKKTGFVFKPDKVFVIVLGINTLILSKVDSKERFISILIQLSHKGCPIIVHFSRIISTMIVDNSSTDICCFVDTTIYTDITFCFEEVFLCIKWTMAFFRIIKRNGNYTWFRKSC